MSPTPQQKQPADDGRRIINEIRGKIAANLKDVKHILVVASGKGGVGKTTVAVNLAAGLVNRGFSAGILDADITGPNVPLMLDLEDAKPEVVPGKERFKPVPGPNNLKVMFMEFLLQRKDMAVIWRGPLKMRAINQLLGQCEWGELDFLIIDLPPGTSDEPLSIAQNVPHADGVVIVATPQDVAMLDVKKSINFASKVQMKVVGIIENMSGFTCPNCGEKINIFNKGGAKKAAGELNLPFLGEVPINPKVVEMSDKGKPSVNTIEEIKEAYDIIIDNILKQVNEKEKSE
jgi:Mrp family chromosome partitioning ATPase